MQARTCLRLLDWLQHDQTGWHQQERARCATPLRTFQCLLGSLSGVGRGCHMDFLGKSDCVDVRGHTFPLFAFFPTLTCGVFVFSAVSAPSASFSSRLSSHTSLTHSHTYTSLTFTHTHTSYNHSLTHSLTHPPTHPPTHPLTHSLTHSPTHTSLTHTSHTSHTSHITHTSHTQTHTHINTSLTHSYHSLTHTLISLITHTRITLTHTHTSLTHTHRSLTHTHHSHTHITHTHTSLTLTHITHTHTPHTHQHITHTLTHHITHHSHTHIIHLLTHTHTHLASLGLRRSAGGFCVAGVGLAALPKGSDVRPSVRRCPSGALVAFAWQAWGLVHCKGVRCTPRCPPVSLWRPLVSAALPVALRGIER